MAHLFENFTQPATVGAASRATVAGDAILNRDQIVLFVGFGTYSVRGDIVADPHPFFRQYDLQLITRSNPSSNTIPKGTPLVLEAEGVTHYPLNYSAVIALNFREADYRSLELAGNITFNLQNHNPGKSIVVKIRNTSGTLSRTLAFPPSWIFLGSPGRPASIAASRTGILSITCFGTSDADVIAAWAVQA